MKSALEETLALQIAADALPAPEQEYRFHCVRKWRFDFAWPELMLGVEVEGGTWIRGRHTRGYGFEKDCEKYNEAALEGWLVLRFTGGMVRDGRALSIIKRAMERMER